MCLKWLKQVSMGVAPWMGEHICKHIEFVYEFYVQKKKKEEREGDRRERALYVWICQKMVAACDRCQAWTFWLKYLSLKGMLDHSTHLHPSQSTKKMVRKIQGRIKREREEDLKWNKKRKKRKISSNTLLQRLLLNFCLRMPSLKNLHLKWLLWTTSTLNGLLWTTLT